MRRVEEGEEGEEGERERREGEREKEEARNIPSDLMRETCYREDDGPLGASNSTCDMTPDPHNSCRSNHEPEVTPHTEPPDSCLMT